YGPLSSAGNFFEPTVIVRVKPGAASPLPGIRGIINSLNPRLAPPDIENVEVMMAGTIALPRFTMLLLTSFTLLAVLLAAIGLYGVLAYSVAQRSREIGIRVALGAPQSRIARLVVTQAVVLAAIGGVIGLLAAHRAAKFISSMLYGVTVND